MNIKQLNKTLNSKSFILIIQEYEYIHFLSSACVTKRILPQTLSKFEGLSCMQLVEMAAEFGFGFKLETRVNDEHLDISPSDAVARTRNFIKRINATCRSQN